MIRRVEIEHTNPNFLGEKTLFSSGFRPKIGGKLSFFPMILFDVIWSFRVEMKNRKKLNFDHFYRDQGVRPGFIFAFGWFEPQSPAYQLIHHSIASRADSSPVKLTISTAKVLTLHAAAR